MKLQLPDVTLVMMDGTCPELARLALIDSLEHIDFGDVLCFSPTDLKVPGAQWCPVKAWSSVQGYCEFLWHDLPGIIETPFMLNIQWDGWIIDAGMWDNDFLIYDFIGAPWWHNEYNVGNGTGIRSMALMRYLLEHSNVFPVKGKEDELLGRIYRPTLEQHGFTWAPEQLASKFSFECTRPSVESRHFMFHDSFNFPAVLSGERLEERIRLMKANPYILKGNKLQELEQGRKALILDRLA